MTPQSRSPFAEAERQYVEAMRPRYEAEGFTFTTHPGADQLPDFLRSYRPDALARKEGRNIAIAVKRQGSPATEPALADIRRLFDGHPDWHFRVVFLGGDPLQSVTIPPTEPARIRGGIDEVRALADQGHHRPAFLMGWSLLEAALRARDRGASAPARPPNTVVQSLAMNGYIGPDTERKLRALIDLRGRIAHGDLAVEPGGDAVMQVLSAVDETLCAG